MISPEEAQIIHDACHRTRPLNCELILTKVLGESATHIMVQALYRHDDKPRLFSIRSFEIEVAQGGE